MDLAQDRDRRWALVNAVMNLRVPYNAGDFKTSRNPVSFSRRTLVYGISKHSCSCPILYVTEDTKRILLLKSLSKCCVQDLGQRVWFVCVCVCVCVSVLVCVIAFRTASPPRNYAHMHTHTHTQTKPLTYTSHATTRSSCKTAPTQRRYETFYIFLPVATMAEGFEALRKCSCKHFIS